ncbi:MAG: IclR family transcriptional regulator [Deltaproteobacteria bacterium]|nr:IclR family transcriptional regulator [Deltaproteobacteria bacterium]
MNSTGAKNRRYKVQSVERALDILDCFSFQNREMNLSDLVRKTGLNKTTTKRLISNLADRGFLRQNPNTKQYQLGMRLFELGGIVFSSLSLRHAAAYPMSRLQNETGATVLLGTAMDDEIVYVDKREGKGMIRISSDIGWRRPLHYGMLGMVLMADLDSKEVRRILKKSPLQGHTPFSITDEDAFSLRLGEIRKQNYVLEHQEALEGVIGIAAPIRDYSRKVIAALGIAVTLGQHRSKKELDDLVARVKKACDEISHDLGYLRI